MERIVEEMQPAVFNKLLSFTEINIQVSKLGNDYNIIVYGGERPHVGCTVLAVPRPSLKGDGTISTTASVLNVTGHKDEMICRYLAEQISKRENAVVACTGGFHKDGITEGQIQEVLEAVKEIEGQIWK